MRSSFSLPAFDCSPSLRPVTAYFSALSVSSSVRFTIFAARFQEFPVRRFRFFLHFHHFSAFQRLVVFHHHFSCVSDVLALR